VGIGEGVGVLVGIGVGVFIGTGVGLGVGVGGMKGVPLQIPLSQKLEAQFSFWEQANPFGERTPFPGSV
jgi:TctA family transporter